MEIMNLDDWSLVDIKDVISEKKEFAKQIQKEASSKENKVKKSRIIAVRKLIKPVDLYCYLMARFGKPNGMQSLMLNADIPDTPNPDSGNLIHWDYEIKSGNARISITGLTREVHFFPSTPLTDAQWLDFFEKIKSDFAKYGKQKSEIQSKLERWIVFQNPYVAIANVCADLYGDITEMEEVAEKFIAMGSNSFENEEYSSQLKSAGNRAQKIYGNTLQLRLLTPILGEAFLNFFAEILLKKNIRHDEAKWSEWKRRPINEKLDTLHEDFIGFIRPLNKETDAYKSFMRIRARRNDDLHANILPERDQFETVYFDDKIPLYAEPGDIFQKFWQNYERLVEPDKAIADYESMHAFFIEVLENVVPPLREQFRPILEEKFPGYNPHTKRYGKPFPDQVVHFSLGDIVEYDDQLKP